MSRSDEEFTGGPITGLHLVIGCVIAILFWAIVISVVAGFWWLFLTMTANAHQATPTAAQPQGWVYPQSCCSGVDCAEIPASAVKEGPNGYEITIVKGQHPMAPTKDYRHVVPYSVARPSPDGVYHLCIRGEAYVDEQRFMCFFAGPRGA